MVRSKKTPLIRKRYVLWPAVAILAIVLVGAGFALHSRITRHNQQSPAKSANKAVNSINYSPPKSSDNAANDTRKSSPNPADTLDNGPTANNTSNPLGVTIINARRNGTDVRVGNIVTGTTTGTCTLTATQDGQASPAPVTAQVQLDVNNYDCGVMHITFPNTGTWQVKLMVTSGANTATTTTSVGTE